MVRIAELEKGNYWGRMSMYTETDMDGKIQVVMRIIDDIIQLFGNVHGGVLSLV